VSTHSTIGRVLLGAGALLLFATAVFHSTGLSMVGGWLTGERADVLKLLWMTPAVDWTLVALFWAYVALRRAVQLRGVAMAAALFPLTSAAGLFATVGTAHPGPFMLGGAALLAVAGAAKLGASNP